MHEFERACAGAPGLRDILELLLSGAEECLPGQMVGLYLSGSLASGGFDSRSSDIDFLVVTRQEITLDELDRLNRMHRRILASGARWANGLEGSYFPAHAIRRSTGSDAAYPHLGQGKDELRMELHGSDWIIHRHILRESGVRLSGSPIRDLIDPVSPHELQLATLAILYGWWEPMLGRQPNPMEHLDYRYYAVQTMCRMLYTLTFGTIVSKPVATAWAMRALDPGWVELIEESLAWPREERPGSYAKTLEFIRHAIRVSRAGSPA